MGDAMKEQLNTHKWCTENTEGYEHRGGKAHRLPSRRERAQK